MSKVFNFELSEWSFHIGVHMACFGPSLNNPPPPPPPWNKKMRLAKPATVSNFERLKTLCGGITADSVILFFLSFFCFHIGVYMACIRPPSLNNSLAQKDALQTLWRWS